MPKRLQQSENRQRPAKRTVILHTRVDEELALRIQQLADSEERKVSQYIARVLRNHVAELDKAKE